MSRDPEVALEEFIAAVRQHFHAASHRTSDTDPSVQAAYMELADAFEIYEDALYAAHDEVTPFELFDDVEDAKEDGDDDDDDDDEYDEDLDGDEDDDLDTDDDLDAGDDLDTEEDDDDSDERR